MFGGLAIVMGWMFLGPRLRDSRIVVENQGIQAYQGTEIVANDIIAAINNEVVLEDFGVEAEF